LHGILLTGVFFFMDQNDALNGQDNAADENLENEKGETMSMETLLEQGELSLDLPRQGEIRIGVVASAGGDEILVSIGAKSEGVIPGRELEQLSAEDREAFQVGNEIPVFVVSPESRQGTLLLSYLRALEEEDWDRAEELMRTRDIFEGEIEGYNKGGLIVHMGRLRGFVPASQIGHGRRMGYRGDTPEQRWGKMVGEIIVSRVIEVDRQRRRLILSERAASQESRESMKDRLLEELEQGDIRTGRVTSLADFGAFVNISGADGLVHLSEISWDRINHPKEVLKVGQEIKVKVISVDKDRKRIGLSIRQLLEDPWQDMVDEYRVGQLVDSEIVRLTKFGAFARIIDDDELEGLVHISELSDRRIDHPKEVVSVGDRLVLRIIKIDKDRRRIGLSLRKVDSLAYSDLDWQLAMAEMDQADEEENSEAPSTEEPVAELVTEEEVVESEDEVEEEGAEETSEEAEEQVEEGAEETSEEAEEQVEEGASEETSEEAEEQVEEEESEETSEEAEEQVEEGSEETSEEAEEQTEEEGSEETTEEAEEQVEEEGSEETTEDEEGDLEAETNN
jgi:small subunit ribosomal protein S1